MYFVRVFMRCDGRDTLIPGTSIEEIERQVEIEMTPALLRIFGLIIVDRVDISDLTPAPNVGEEHDEGRESPG